MNAGNDDIDEEAQEMAALKQMAQTVESLEAEAKKMKAALAEAVQRAAENSRKRREREVDKTVDSVRSKVVKIDSAVGDSIKFHKEALERCKTMSTSLRGMKRNLGAARSEAVDGDRKRLDSVESAVDELWNAVSGVDLSRAQPLDVPAVTLASTCVQCSTVRLPQTSHLLFSRSQDEAGFANIFLEVVLDLEGYALSHLRRDRACGACSANCPAPYAVGPYHEVVYLFLLILARRSEMDISP